MQRSQLHNSHAVITSKSLLDALIRSQKQQLVHSSLSGVLQQMCHPPLLCSTSDLAVTADAFHHAGCHVLL